MNKISYLCTSMATYSNIRFMLDSFRHFIAADEVENFIRRIVGKRVMLVPDNDNPYDRNCIEGFFNGVPCCHVSARKAPDLKEYMRIMGVRSLLVQVKGNNLEQGYMTAYCEIEPQKPMTDDFKAEHERMYREWVYAGSGDVTLRNHRLLLANTDYLLMRLDAADATEEELMPVIEHYLPMLPWVFSKEDKEYCIKVNIMLQNSRIEGVRAYNSQLIDALDHLNHQEIRTQTVRRWLDELKASAACRAEAEGIDATELERRENNLGAFPDGLLGSYRRDFSVFCANLYYNDIPQKRLQEFMTGIAVCELVRERMADHPKKAEKGVGASCYPFVIDQSMAEAVVDRIRSYMQGKDRSQPRDIMMAVRAAQDAGVIRRIRYNEMQDAFPDFCPNSPASVSKYTKEDETPYTDEAFKDMVKGFEKMKRG